MSTVGRAGVARIGERGNVEINNHYKEWRLNQNVWVQESNAPDAGNGRATLVTERGVGRHYVADFYRLSGGPAIVALICDIKPQTGRPWFVISANGNLNISTVYRLRPAFAPEIQSAPNRRLARSSVLPIGSGFFRCRTQVLDLDGIGFFMIATLNLAGNANYSANLNLGYHLANVRLRYLCL